MPRKVRFNIPGIPQHIIQRGNNRQPCFLLLKDYSRYIDDLTKASSKYCCHVHAYVLMTNHVHLLVTPTVDYGISNMMQALGRRYVYYINKSYNRTGTLWEGRYKSSLIDADSYFLTCMRYIELNPVRAGIVDLPGEYKWSSYHANTQLDNNDLIKNHPVYSQLGSSRTKRQKKYRELFQNPINNYFVEQIQDALNHELVLGTKIFKDKIEKQTNRQTRIGKPGRPSNDNSNLTPRRFNIFG